MRDTIESGLRRIFRLNPQPDHRGWGCLTESEVASFAEGRVPDQKKARLVSHLDQCAYCREQLSFLAQSNQATSLEPVPAEWLARARNLVPSTGYAPPFWRIRWGAAAAALACLILAGVFTIYWPRLQNHTVSDNGLSEAVTVRGGPSNASLPEVISPASGASVFAQGLSFRWKAVQGAREYEVNVVSVSGDLVWKERTAATAASLPPGVNLISGQKYFVWIRAYLREDKDVRSRAIPFIISNPN